MRACGCECKMLMIFALRRLSWSRNKSYLKGRYMSRDELSAPESWARTWRAMGSSGEDGSKLELGKIVEVSGKGLGVVATRDAVAGEVIAREQGPMAISLSRDQLGVRCCRCARRAARSSATRRCNEGCGAMWCSPECVVADTHLHADSGECSFLLDIGPDPRVAMCQPCGPGDRRTGRRTRRRVESDWVTRAAAGARRPRA